jgi:hypothetical protein
MAIVCWRTDTNLRGGARSNDCTLVDNHFPHNTNTWTGPGPRPFFLGADGKWANPCEKPSSLAKFIFERYVNPNDYVFILGSGAGGDLEGAIRARRNVVAIERNAVQWKHTLNHFHVVKNDIVGAYKEIIAKKKEETELMKKNEKARYEKFKEMEKKWNEEKQKMMEDKLSQARAHMRATNCLICHLPLEYDDPVYPCSGCGGVAHQQPGERGFCFFPCDDCFLRGVIFCSERCHLEAASSFHPQKVLMVLHKSSGPSQLKLRQRQFGPHA